MTAKCNETQDPVQYVVCDGKMYIFIYLNERECTDAEETGYEYDYHEFICEENEIDLSDVLKNPEKYMDYPKIIPTISEAERIKQLEDALDAQLKINEVQDETLIELYELMEGIL